MWQIKIENGHEEHSRWTNIKIDIMSISWTPHCIKVTIFSQINRHFVVKMSNIDILSLNLSLLINIQSSTWKSGAFQNCKHNANETRSYCFLMNIPSFSFGLFNQGVTTSPLISKACPNTNTSAKAKHNVIFMKWLDLPMIRLLNSIMKINKCVFNKTSLSDKNIEYNIV